LKPGIREKERWERKAKKQKKVKGRQWGGVQRLRGRIQLHLEVGEERKNGYREKKGGWGGLKKKQKRGWEDRHRF